MSGKLVGGSSGEPVRGANVPFFYPEVKSFEPNSKNSYGGRLLPGFIFDDSGTPIDPLSVAPYRDKNNTDPQTNKEKFTSWYFSLKGYKWVGKEGRAFLSPLTLQRTDKRGIDPLFDCYLAAWAAKNERPDWHKLTEKPKNDPKNRNAVLENFRVFGATNVLQDLGQGKFENRICVSTTACMTDLKEQLDRYTPLGDQPSDPDWPRYLLGDVTSPTHGLWFSIKEGVFNTAGMKTMLFNFSQQKDRLVGHSKWPIDIQSAWGQDVLRRRYNIADTDKVTKITSAEEILEFIVSDGFLPQELIHVACSDHWTVPAGHVNRTFSPPPAQPVGQAPAYPAAQPAAYQPPAYQPPAPPAPQNNDGDLGPVAQQMFWVSFNGQTIPKPMSGAQVRGMVTSSHQDILVCLESNPSDWRPASQFGIRAVATPPSAPVPPQPPTPPQAPTPPTPPPTPTAPTPSRTVAPPPPPTGSFAPPPPPSAQGGGSFAPPPPPVAQGGGSFAPPPPPSAPAAPPVPQQPPAHVPPTPPSSPMGGPPPTPSWPAPAGGAPSVQQAANYPASPLHQQAPSPAPAAPPPAAPVAPPVNGTVQPLTQAEYEELMALEKEWEGLSGGNGIMDPNRMNRYASLSDRYAALKQAGVAK